MTPAGHHPTIDRMNGITWFLAGMVSAVALICCAMVAHALRTELARW